MRARGALTFVLERVSDRGEDPIDLAGEDPERGDRADRDERDNERVLDERLSTLLVSRCRGLKIPDAVRRLSKKRKCPLNDF